MDTFLQGADLCEEYRLLDQARLLRSMAKDNGGKVYLLAERGAEYNDNWVEVDVEDGEFRNVFTERDAAQRAADIGNARRFREINLRDFGGAGNMTSVDWRDLDARINHILSNPFQLDSPDHDEPIILPASLTDEQMIAIARLFDKMQFFHVIEAEFGG